MSSSSSVTRKNIKRQIVSVDIYDWLPETISLYVTPNDGDSAGVELSIKETKKVIKILKKAIKEAEAE